LIYYALSQGARGCISGLGNVMPATLNAICTAFDEGKIEEAKKQQDLFTQLRVELYALGYPPAMVKRALYLMDNSVGASRRPALLSTPELDAKISGIIEKFAIV
jgi:4-hydroxy-tetrahydrodipicolinate synthase